MVPQAFVRIIDWKKCRVESRPHFFTDGVEIVEACGTPREFAAFQKSLLERILRETGGNRAGAARLGWDQNSFRRRCGELDLE